MCLMTVISGHVMGFLKGGTTDHDYHVAHKSSLSSLNKRDTLSSAFRVINVNLLPAKNVIMVFTCFLLQ